MGRLVVGISGNFSRPSKTKTLVTTVVEEAAIQRVSEAVVYDLVDAMAGLATATSLTCEYPQLQRMWNDVIACDVLVVGSPDYKASYSGLLKHFFDLLDMTALKDKPVAVLATAKAPQHALMIDHQLKPLFGFFGARIATNSIFATDEAFLGNGVPSNRTRSQVCAVARELAVLAEIFSSSGD